MSNNNQSKNYRKIRKNVKVFRNSLNITFTILLLILGMLLKSIPFLIASIVVGGVTAFLLKMDNDEKTKEQVEYVNMARKMTNKMSGKSSTKKRSKK